MKNIVKIIKISRPLHPVAVLISILIVITSLLELATPIFSKFIVDEITNKTQDGSADTHKLIFWIGMAFVFSLISLVLTSVTNRLGDHFAGRLRKFLTEKYYHKVLTLPQSYFDSELSGKIVNQLNRGISSIGDFANTSTNFLLPMFLQSVFTIAVLAKYNVPIAFFTFILFPIYTYLSYYSSKKWGESEVAKNQIEDKSRGRIQEVVMNMILVKSFNRQKSEYQFISNKLAESNQIYATQSKSFHIFDFLRGLSLNFILLLINIVVFLNTFQGKLTIGEMVLIIQLVAQARRPLFAMSFILSRIQSAESGSKEFFEVLNLESTDQLRNVKISERIKNPSLKFENVSFQYEKSEGVLQNVSFEILPLQRIALVGHSGAGKSTVVNLILKFYDPTRGSISLSGKDYKNLDSLWIRENISLVFQDNELFSSTIKENILYGKEKATDKEIIQALRLANAYEFVKKFPHGINSEIGERGVRLSGGQKQRIQIARAILKNAPILILDEATSSLDAKSEKEVQMALENLMKDKLVIIIAHRFSTIQDVDHILVIDKGKIVDNGTPGELAKKEGLYRDLLNYQVEGNKKLLQEFEIY
ncbi:MAG: ABC transporter ATP-binding protein [Candidatus Levybacteria bacterium]|nr:ABC transporter ATP-binding protein [Candidatus Levybacteria bacterium]